MQLANFYGPRSGGLRTAVDQLGARYVAAGHRCTLVVPDDHDAIDVVDGRTIVRIRSPRAPGLGGYRMIVDRRAVRSAAAAVRPDVVELSDKTTLAGVAARLRRTAGTPTVLISHERLGAVLGEALGGRGASHRGLRAFNTRLAERVDAIVCASAFAADEFRDLPGAAAVHRVPLGVDLDVFRPDGATGREHPARIVAVVRLSPEKRPGDLVATSRALVARGIAHELTIFGDGPRRPELERAAGGLPVRFAGHESDRRVIAMALASADVAIAPGPHETFGLAALEMLACGTPVVVPDRGALAEMVADGVGVAVGSDGDAYAAAVADLLTGDRHEQRRRARAYAEGFGWDRTAGRLLALYRSLVAGPGAAPEPERAPDAAHPNGSASRSYAAAPTRP